MSLDEDQVNELQQEAREEPFYAWAESLDGDDLLGEARVSKSEFIAEHKEQLMTSFHEGD